MWCESGAWCGRKKGGRQGLLQSAIDRIAVQCASYVISIFGDTKKSNSWSASWALLVLNRWPTTGMLPNRGIYVADLVLEVTVMPPKITVPPSGTSTCVVACWVLMLGPAVVTDAPTEEFCTAIIMKMFPSSVTWGVTESCRVAAT